LSGIRCRCSDAVGFDDLAVESESGAHTTKQEETMLGLLLQEARRPLLDDAAMIANFRRNRACFEQIRAMAALDTARGLWRIAPDFLKTETNTQPSAEQERTLLTSDRWRDYRRLFACIGGDTHNSGVEMGHGRVDI